MNAIEKAQSRLVQWSSPALSASLIGVAILLILVAVLVKNKWIKAGILAYEVLP